MVHTLLSTNNTTSLTYLTLAPFSQEASDGKPYPEHVLENAKVEELTSSSEYTI